MNDDFVRNVAYISEELNSLADEASPYVLGMYLDASKPLAIEEVMEVRRILNEFNALALLLRTLAPVKQHKSTRNNSEEPFKK